MELTWSALALICIAAAAAWFWQDSLGARETANAAALEACQRLNLQFLDGTVAFARLSLTRENGWLTLRRTYVFDYTANSIERRQGFIVLAGRRIESVGYARDEIAQPQHARTAAPSTADHATVVNLEDRRVRAAGSSEVRPKERADQAAGASDEAHEP